MATILGVYIPTFGRPDKLQAVADNLKAATKSPYNLYWGVEPFDKASIKAAKKTGYPIILNRASATYSNALQAIYDQTNEQVFLWANDDFKFLDGWDVEPLNMMKADPNIGVLGVHDGNPQTKYSTISFIRRSYIQEQSGVIDTPGRVLYPYEHNYVDDELTETAQKRGVWDRYPGPCIEHQHHSFKWLGDFPIDETYRKNEAKFSQDTQTYYGRRHLWM